MITRKQREALYRIWLRTQEPHVPPSQRPSYRAFRARAQEHSTYLLVPFAGMWIGIENGVDAPDGYTHS